MIETSSGSLTSPARGICSTICVNAYRFAWSAVLAMVVLLLLSVEASAQAQNEVSRLVERKGDLATANAARWSDAQEWEFVLDGKWEPRGTAKFFRWGQLAETGRTTGVALSDGSLLSAERWKLEGDRLQVTLATGVEFVVPRSRAIAVVRAWPAAPLERSRQLRAWRLQAETRDQVQLASGDMLNGIVLGGAFDAGEAADESPSPKPAEKRVDDSSSMTNRLRLELARGETSVEISAVNSIVFRAEGRVERRGDSPRWVIGLDDGSLLQVMKLEAKAGRLHGELLGGVVWECDRNAFCESICFVQPIDEPDRAASNSRYVSDLESAGYRHVSWLGREWPFARDGNVLGGDLRAGDRTYVKGIGMHATSRLAFDLEGRFDKLRGEVALDDAAESRGSVVFRAYVDRGDGQWTQVYASEVVRGGTPPTPIEVDVKSAVRLALIVDAADHGPVSDYANWLDLRLEQIPP